MDVLSPADIPPHHEQFMQQAAEAYLSKKRFHQWRKKQRFHDLAILVDPAESTPPSNKKALEMFVNAGESLGLNIDFIDKNDSKSLAEYDALFIRTTTSVDHYTYQFARRATQDNLVVIDDPQSIVRCSNKVYLAELLRSHQILTPDTLLISKYDKAIPQILFPCVMKKPDGAFSQGVVKINNQNELQKSLKQFFKTSDLILIQPFLPTAFDWRIGIIDNKPLYASRYFMAKDHWQIYNWESRLENEGDADTVALDKVPDGVIKTALKATRLIGDGLYGVDIKSIADKHYIIEVNDNPNIDANNEDQVTGEALYRDIMSVFLQRIRRKHGYV
jgi:glutathione synthase/RimK-type ligase-like ATP-grasp enzyme